MARVFVDTNVLVPFSLMDLMLSLAEDRIHDLVWSDALLDEWQRVIVREGHRSEGAAALIASHIRAGFVDGRVSVESYRSLLADLDGPDDDDLNHMAAAIRGNANTLVTWNVRDFPAKALASHGVVVMAPDPYLCGLLDQFTLEVVETIARMAAGKRRPPMTAKDVVSALDRAGITVFAYRVLRLLPGQS